MAAIDYSQFHELAEQFRGEMPLKKICEQEGVCYRSYLAWRKKNGLPLHMRRQHGAAQPQPAQLAELETVGLPAWSPMATSVHIEFENGHGM